MSCEGKEAGNSAFWGSCFRRSIESYDLCEAVEASY